jgi:trimeric autotransporter adhesin
MNRIIQLKQTTPVFLIALSLACVALLPKVQAVVPPPDGGYPGFNTAEGQNALLNLTSGSANTAVGWFSLQANTSGSFNTGVGAGTLLANIADNNTAIGAGALLSNTTGVNNTANGALALLANTEGESNSAFGRDALASNVTGGYNTAIGRWALADHETGAFNTALGVEALSDLVDGRWNTAVGYRALLTITSGDFNTAVGFGGGANITGEGNVCIGSGVAGEAGVDDRTYIRNINTTTQSFSAGVNDYVTVRLTDGRLGHTQVVSSQRYKEDIKPLATVSEALYALKPVSFRLKKEYDETQALGFGLIAEEVEKVDPTLVYRNNKGQVESVRYEMVNAMLLNEFLKEHRKNEEQEATIARQQKQIDALTAGLQKVSAQVEASKAARQVVKNP